jgi:hypothetical protein
MIIQSFLGNYYGQPENIVTVCQGLSVFARTNCVFGCDINSTNTSGFAGACSAASAASVTVLVMGMDESIEREGHDRPTISLPGLQSQFISRMAKCSKGSVVLVLVSGGPLDITAQRNDPDIDAIIWAGPLLNFLSILKSPLNSNFFDRVRWPIRWHCTCPRDLWS